MPKVISPESIDEIIRNGHKVFIQGGTGEPQSLVNALQVGPKISKSVNYVSISIPGVNGFNPTSFHPGAKFTTFFQHRSITNEDNSHATHFIPLHYRDIFRYLQDTSSFDVALIQLSPPDRFGMCSMGVSVDFIPAVIDRAKVIIAQINPNFPPSPHAPSIEFTKLDYIVYGDGMATVTGSPSTTPESINIAKNVSSLIEDGSCLQVGIGKLPSAILNQLTDRKHLGLHSGLLSGDVKNLIELGVLTGERKTIDRGKHICGIALGSASLYQWCAAHRQVNFKAVNYTHCQTTISGINNFVSINSVLEVDLWGQANAEWVDGNQVSAVGGLVDFVRGARHSHRGKSIFALPATALKGSLSRIIPNCARTSVSRYDIDHVVTEYGVASLAYLSVENRAQALIEIAAPTYRAELSQYLESQLSNTSIR
jgi:4-hydroxybutyrate CoA-transferase